MCSSQIVEAICLLFSVRNVALAMRISIMARQSLASAQLAGWGHDTLRRHVETRSALGSAASNSSCLLGAVRPQMQGTLEYRSPLKHARPVFSCVSSLNCSTFFGNRVMLYPAEERHWSSTSTVLNAVHDGQQVSSLKYKRLPRLVSCS